MTESPSFSGPAAERLPQACAVPYRRDSNDVEFCLITSSSTRRWGFPKGMIEPGDTAPETALKEAHEEAGLSGKIVGPPLGQYEYAKWGRTLSVTAFLMQVDRWESEWLESHVRRRQWASVNRARDDLSQDHLRALLEEAYARVTGNQ